MQLIDTHCHLQFAKLAEREAEVLAEAKKAGIHKMISVGTSLADSQKCVEIAGRHDNVWASAGAHPHDGKDFPDNGAEVLEELLTSPKIVAVGEIGLDYFKDYSPREEQCRIFELQIKVGLPSGLPFIFHVRDAWQDFWPIFDKYQGLRGVIHSFSASKTELDQALKRGLYIGLNGIMTFTKDEAQLAAAKSVPLNRLLLETDAPFLAPQGYRGQTCEPKHIRDIAEYLAELRDESLEELAAATTKNAEELFGI